MSGVETLGVLASSSQLAAYGIKIVLHLTELYKGVRNRPSQTRERLDQVRELIETANLIQQNKSLQSPVIHAQLQATLTEARSVSHLLRDIAAKHTESSIQRLWTLLSGASEQEILARLQSLERKKSALQLCINIVQVELLSSIRSSVDKAPINAMSNKPDNSQAKGTTACPTEEEPFQIIGGQKVPLKVRKDNQEGSLSKTKPTPAAARTQRPGQAGGKVFISGHSYAEARSSDNAKQRLGDLNADNFQGDSKSHAFGTITASGNCQQDAGNVNGTELAKIALGQNEGGKSQAG